MLWPSTARDGTVCCFLTVSIVHGCTYVYVQVCKAGRNHSQVVIVAASRKGRESRDRERGQRLWQLYSFVLEREREGKRGKGEREGGRKGGREEGKVGNGG